MQEKTKDFFSINERIFQLLEYHGHSSYEAAKKTGISEQIFSNLKKNKNRPSAKTIEKLLNLYEVVNEEWLFSGKGEMIKNKTLEEESVVKESVISYERKDMIKYLIEKVAELDMRINRLEKAKK